MPVQYKTRKPPEDIPSESFDYVPKSRATRPDEPLPDGIIYEPPPDPNQQRVQKILDERDEPSFIEMMKYQFKRNPLVFMGKDPLRYMLFIRNSRKRERIDPFKVSARLSFSGGNWVET